MALAQHLDFALAWRETEWQTDPAQKNRADDVFAAAMSDSYGSRRRGANAAAFVCSGSAEPLVLGNPL